MDKVEAVITIRVTTATKTRLEELARHDRRKLSQYVSNLIDDHLAAMDGGAALAPPAARKSPALAPKDADADEPRTDIERGINPPEYWIESAKKSEALLAKKELTKKEQADIRKTLKYERWMIANPGKNIADWFAATRKESKNV